MFILTLDVWSRIIITNYFFLCLYKCSNYLNKLSVFSDAEFTLPGLVTPLDKCLTSALFPATSVEGDY